MTSCRPFSSAYVNARPPSAAPGSLWKGHLDRAAPCVHGWTPTTQRMPPTVYREAAGKLSRLGERMLTDVRAMALDADTNLPRLEQYDAFGHRVDRLMVAKGWTDMHDVAAQEGLVATAYERQYGEHSRVLQMAMVRATHGAPDPTLSETLTTLCARKRVH